MVERGTASVAHDEPAALEPGGTNSIGRALGLLGDEWTLLIIQQALRGLRRYGQFMDALPISNSTLTSRLALLGREGLLERNLYQSNPPRAEYLPTARTRSLWPVMLSIWEWERHWVPERASGLPVMRHTTCGRDFAPVMCCRMCGRPVAARDVRAAWGPSGTWARSVPSATTRRRSESDSPTGVSGLFPDTMAIFGNRWSSALMGAAFRGLTRFSEFEAALGAPPTLIADRLRLFVAIGVFEAADNLSRSDWVEYCLTGKGLAFFPVTAASLRWAEHWFRAPEGPALVMTHRACGETFSAAFGCDQCGEALAGADIAIVPAGGSESPTEGET